MGDYSAAIPYFGPIVISPQSQRQTLRHSKLIGVKPPISSHVWSSSWGAQWSWENSAHLRTSEGTRERMGMQVTR